MSKKNNFFFRKQIEKLFQFLSLIVCIAVFNEAQAAPLPDGTLLTIAPGAISNGECVSGSSCIGFEITPGVISWRILTPGTDRGIIIGEDQISGRQELNANSLFEGAIAAAHNFIVDRSISLAIIPVTGAVSGQVLTGSELNIFDGLSCSGAACIGKTVLGTMSLAYNNVAFKFGSDGGCFAEPTSVQCTVEQGSGIFVNWQVNADNSYVLDYNQIVAQVDSRSFPGGVQMHLHLEGKIISRDAAGIVFSDQSSSKNITHEDLTNSNGASGGGGAWIDVDNNGYPDLFIPSETGGVSNWFYYNNFGRDFTDMSDQAGFSLITGTSRGVAVGDYDGDGCDDIFIANGESVRAPLIGSRVNTLYHNDFCDTGSILFTDVTQSANLVESSASSVASFGDVNGDGYLDLYVGNYLPGGRNDLIIPLDSCHPNQFYLNNGNGTFTEMSVNLGINNTGCTLATTLTDYDNDGDLDIYVVNDFSSATSFSTQFISPDVIYENVGNVNGIPQFAPAVSTNLTDSANGMSIAVGDYDNDLDLDYYSTSYVFSNFNTNILNQNQGDNTFLNQTIMAGVADAPLDINISGGAWVGWGSVFFDVDNDGYLDLYKVNGTIGTSAGFGQNFNQPNRLYYNNRNKTFDNIGGFAGVDGVLCDGVTTSCISNTGNIPFTNQGRGVAVADYDLDGDMDLLVVNLASIQTGGTLLEPGRAKLYRNDSKTSNNYVRVTLQGLNPNHRGIGAKIFLITPDGNQQMREINAGTGHGSTHEFTAHFGVGINSLISSLRVEWPSGCTEEVNTNAIVVNRNTNRVSESNCTRTGNGSFRGRVIDSKTGEGIPEATVIAFGSEIEVASTGANGFYAIENMLPGSYGILVIVPDGYLTTEGNATFKTCDSGIRRELLAGTTLVENCTLDPVPTFTLSGTVTDSTGAALAGVEVRALNGNTTTTLANGSYSLQVENGGAYISPKATGLTFTPFGQFIFMLSQSKTLNFVANP